MSPLPLHPGRRSAGIPAALVLLGASLAAPSPASAAVHPAAALTRSRSIAVQPETVRTLTVRCPAGFLTVGGGVTIAPPAGSTLADISAKLLSSAPTADGTGWHGAMTSSVPPGTRTLTVRVRCRPASAVGGYVIRHRDLPFNVGDQRSGSLGCGKGRRIVTGGVLWNPSGAGGMPKGSDNLFVSSPDATGRRWRAAGFSYHTTVLRIIVLCRPAAAVGSIVVAHAETSGTGTVAAQTACPAGRRATAGGADWYTGGSPSSPSGTLEGLMVSPDGKRWTARALPSGAAALRVTLLCLPA